MLTCMHAKDLHDCAGSRSCNKCQQWRYQVSAWLAHRTCTATPQPYNNSLARNTRVVHLFSLLHDFRSSRWWCCTWRCANSPRGSSHCACRWHCCWLGRCSCSCCSSRPAGGTRVRHTTSAWRASGASRWCVACSRKGRRGLHVILGRQPAAAPCRPTPHLP